jgi:hypothetical protein
LDGLARYIATVETAKHRTFQFLDASVLPDNMLIAIALDSALCLGILSSSIHVQWALATGGTLEDRPRYNKSRCFETFPFPGIESGLTVERANRIGVLAEQLDAHRKARQTAHPELTLTGMYNVLERLRAGEALTSKEKVIHEQGLVAVLQSLHDELDAAVLAAYGWSDLSLPGDTDELLSRLVALNAARRAEEAKGNIRWLRPEYQGKAVQKVQGALDMRDQPDEASIGNGVRASGALAKRPWPVGIPEQIKAVADVVADERAALGLDALAARFTGRGRWRDRLPMILESLEALGRVRKAPLGGWLDASQR